MKAAFEHACKIWEERMPPMLPITVSVHLEELDYADTGSTVPLSQVVIPFYTGHTIPTQKYRVLQALESNNFDKYDYLYIYDVSMFDNPSIPDISITYNAVYENLFSYSLDDTSSPEDKFDFITIALRDLRFGLGIFSPSDPNITSDTPYIPQLTTDEVDNPNFFNCPPQKLGEVDRISALAIKDIMWERTLGMYNLNIAGDTPYNDVYHVGNTFVAPYNGNFTLKRGIFTKKAPSQATPKTTQANQSRENILDKIKDYCKKYTTFPLYDFGIGFPGVHIFISVLKKDGTWHKLYHIHDEENLINTYNTSDFNFTGIANEDIARTSHGDIRIRMDRVFQKDFYSSAISTTSYYFSMSYLPQAVQLNYEGVEYVNNLTGMTEDKIDPNPLNIDLSKYTKYHRISLKDTEGANMLRIFNGSNIMVNRNFKSGSFRLKDNGKPTLVSVTAVNDNGSTAGGNVSYNLGTAVGPIHPFQPLLKSNGQTLTFVPDGKDSTETDHFVSYAISSVSELNQTTMTGDFEEDQTVDISTLRPDMYVINCLGASGNTYSFKFTKN